MAKSLLMEEFHVTVFVPSGLPSEDYDAMRRTLDSKMFRVRLRQAARSVLRSYPSLAMARIVITR